MQEPPRGAYAVGKKDLGATVSLLAAASLVVDYVLTVAVSLAAGAASLASAFPSLAHHLLAMCLTGLVLITAVNLWGVAESARVLMQVRHWYGQRTPRWLLRAALNGTGAILTATATAVLVASKFTSGAWVVVLTVPALMLLFSRIQNYYRAVGLELDLGQLPQRPLPAKSLVIVPVGSISKLTEHALRAALSLSDDVVAVSVHPEAAQGAAFHAGWDNWNPGVRLDTLDSPHRSPVHPIVDYVQQAQQGNRQIAVLIPEVQHRRWRYRILQNQRGLLLATVLRANTDVVICTIPYRLTTR